MDNYLTRARNLYGEGLDSLKDRTVLLAGAGGVGSFAFQGLARSGVGRIIVIDKDTVEITNLNRQLVARTDTIGKAKTEIVTQDAERINPECRIIPITDFYDENMNELLDTYQIDYILDCIDSIGSKKDLIRYALDRKIPILSSMGMARKSDPTRLEITELEKTSYDPIAKQLRVWKRKNRIKDRIYVVSSTEKPVDVHLGQQLPSSIFVPGSAGLLMASRCISDLLGGQKGRESWTEN